MITNKRVPTRITDQDYQQDDYCHEQKSIFVANAHCFACIQNPILELSPNVEDKRMAWPFLWTSSCKT